MIYNVNTESRIEAVVKTPGGEVAYTGDARIDGVPGTTSPIVLNFMDVVGSVAGGAGGEEAARRTAATPNHTAQSTAAVGGEDRQPAALHAMVAKAPSLRADPGF